MSSSATARYRERRRAAGLCYFCPEPAERKTRIRRNGVDVVQRCRCVGCAETHRKERRRKYRVIKQRGLCYRCRARPSTITSARCRSCA